MSNVFNLKKYFMTPLIKLIIKHPKLMESKIFLKAMLIFPEKISKSYDLKLKHSDIDYQAALSYAFGLIKRKPQKILDLCTGTGFAAFMALKYFQDSIITGADQSSKMLEMAKGKIEASDSKRINFDFGNAAKLSYEDEAFDLIITSNAPIYLKEAVRVLSRGGDIIVTYSFGGAAFINAESDIMSLLEKNGLHLVNLKNVG